MGGLTWIDWTIVVIYASSTLALGWYFSRRQSDTQEYFVGSGNMNSMRIGVSLFATLLSTISYLSMPGEVLGKRQTGLMQMRVADLVRDAGLLPQIQEVSQSLLAEHPEAAELIMARWIGDAGEYGNV